MDIIRKFALIFMFTCALVPLNVTADVKDTEGVSRAEFIQLMSEHRKRVGYGMLLAYGHFKHYFPDINEALIIRYSGLHDIPKIQGLNELRSWGYKFDQDIATILAKYYGREKGSLDLKGQSELMGAIGELNRIEQLQKEFLLAQYGAENIKANMARVKSQLSKLEHWIDVTDTTLFRGKEFNRYSTIGRDIQRFVTSDVDIALLVSNFSAYMLSKKFRYACVNLLK